ncbi:MAG: aspartate aminotransferase family protein [Gemmatimonadaceae bacterium]
MTAQASELPRNRGADSARGYPAGNVFYRKLHHDYPRIVRGEGCFLYDDTGKRYLDACGGAFVANIGHGVAAIGDAMAAQARSIAYVSGAAFTHDPVEELAAELAALAPGGNGGNLDKVYFLTSGSEATEAALKLARQYWVATGKPEKHKVIALSPSYHGNTILALSASARGHYRSYYSPWLVDVRTIPAPYAYRCGCGGSEDCPACSGAALESAILIAGAHTVAAFIAEPIGGSSTGASVPRGSYFRLIREICDRHEVLFVADEVLTGAGRTGKWTAIEHYGVVPDIMTMGKGIAGGYAPLSAVLAPRRIVDVLERSGTSFMHAQTFSHHAVMCAAGIACVRHIRESNLVERCAHMAPIFLDRLRTLLAMPHVGDVRGCGLLAGVEFVKDKGTRQPFPRATLFAEAFTECAQREGLVVWPNVGHANGVDGDLVMLAPPFIITVEEVDEIVRLFGAALKATLNHRFTI